MDYQIKEKRIIRLIHEVLAQFIDLKNQTYVDWLREEDWRTKKSYCRTDCMEVKTKFSDESVILFCNKPGINIRKQRLWDEDNSSLCNENPIDYIDGYPILKVDSDFVKYLNKQFNKEEFWLSPLLKYLNEIYGTKLTEIEEF